MAENKVGDILGLAPYGEAINTAVTKSFEGVEGFLKLVCAPALEEVGLMLKDHVRYWRLNNILRIIEKAKGKIEFKNEKFEIKAHPRVALAIVENGSLNDNDEVQELWAGLFASSCTLDGQDDENLIFIDLLKQLTVAEARIIKYACENARKIIYPNGLVIADELETHCTSLRKITGVDNFHRLDRELDHLRSMELIGSGLGTGGFHAESEELIADISPTPLALNLYVRTQGFTDSTAEYWKEKLITSSQRDLEREEKEKADEEKRKLARLKVQEEKKKQKELAKQQVIAKKD